MQDVKASRGFGLGHVIYYMVTTKDGQHCLVHRLPKKSKMLSTTWYYEEQMLSMAFVLLSTPRKSSDFAECQISVSKRVVFYLLGPSSGP